MRRYLGLALIAADVSRILWQTEPARAADPASLTRQRQRAMHAAVLARAGAELDDGRHGSRRTVCARSAASTRESRDARAEADEAGGAELVAAAADVCIGVGQCCAGGVDRSRSVRLAAACVELTSAGPQCSAASPTERPTASPNSAARSELARMVSAWTARDAALVCDRAAALADLLVSESGRRCDAAEALRGPTAEEPVMVFGEGLLELLEKHEEEAEEEAAALSMDESPSRSEMVPLLDPPAHTHSPHTTHTHPSPILRCCARGARRLCDDASVVRTRKCTGASTALTSRATRCHFAQAQSPPVPPCRAYPSPPMCRCRQCGRTPPFAVPPSPEPLAS
jgi:hypothetical protein